MINVIKSQVDAADRKILAELDKNCRISTKRLAKMLRKSRQSVDYRINQMKQNGIISSFNSAINPHKMGCKIYKIYLKLRNIPSEKIRLFRYLRSTGIIYWMGECSGRWDLIFGVFSKTDSDFFSLKNDIISRFNKIIVEEEGDILVDVKQYAKMYFTGEIVKPVMFAGDVVHNKLDRLDCLILAETVNNARIHITDLSRKIKSTPIITRRRLRKLEQKGIIIQYRIGVNLNKLGLELYKAILRLDRYNKYDENRLLAYVSALPNVQYFIRNIWQIELELVVSNYQEYYGIIECLKKEFPFVIRTVDSVLMITDEWTPGFKNLYSLSKSFS